MFAILNYKVYEHVVGVDGWFCIMLCLQELKELAALAYRDTTAENREFWKNEMGQALREIQSTYDEKLDSMRGELETYYNMKVKYIPHLPQHNMAYTPPDPSVDTHILALKWSLSIKRIRQPSC